MIPSRLFRPVGAIAALVFALTGAARAATFSYDTSGIFNDVIAESGTYRISLAGGNGSTVLTNGAPGGVGGLVIGEVDLLIGQGFTVVVGGNGADGLNAGGGMSLFTTQSISTGIDPTGLLAVAGGGGGGNSAGFQGGAGGALVGGTGHGGAVLTDTDFFGNFTAGGGGGAGVLSDGDGNNVGGKTAPSFEGSGVAGGFGGGGAGRSASGGGGGGFTGGDGGLIFQSDGKGGTSFVSADFFNTLLTPGDQRSETTPTAFVTIELISADPIPVPAAAPLLGSALAGFGALRWRQRRKTPGAPI
ncbi:MAG: hypothetical protein AAFR65_03230 [Pseudomonadota bacterium]